MQVRVAKPEGLPSGEALLLDYAERLAKHLPGRRAVHVRLGDLQPLNRREQHLRMAASAFDPLVRRAQGQNFRLSNGDLVVVVKDVTVAEIDDVVLRLRFMFGDDPLVHVPDDAVGQTKFCDWFELERQYPAFLALAQARQRQLSERREPERAAAAPVQLQAAPPRQPLDPLRLSKLEAVVATTELKPLLRRRAIAELPATGGVKPIGTELGLSLELLAQKVMPDVNLAADRWLLIYLNAALDRRLATAMADVEGVVPLPTWIRFDTQTLMAPEFVPLDDKLRVVTRKTMVAQIRWDDALRDVPSFVFLRDFLKARKWQVALDGLTAGNFALIDRATLEPDYVKLAWDQTAADATPSRRRAAFLDAIEQAAPGSIVLADCAGSEALQFGRSAGIRLYEGRAVDALLQQRAAAAS